MILEIDYKKEMVCLFNPEGIGYSKFDPYGIIFGRFTEQWQLLSWLKHLHEKTWWNDDLSYQLIIAWETINKHEIGSV